MNLLFSRITSVFFLISLGLRNWSNRISLAYKLVIICPIFWLIVVGHRLIFYGLDHMNRCGPQEGVYAYYDSYFQVIFLSLVPCFVVTTLAMLLIRSIRKLSRRVNPIDPLSFGNMSNHSIIHQMDHHLTKMLLLESIITIITYVPFAIQSVYTNISEDWIKSPLRQAWENIFIELIQLLSYLFFAASFYISISTNVGFRRKIQRFFKFLHPIVQGQVSVAIVHRGQISTIKNIVHA